MGFSLKTTNALNELQVLLYERSDVAMRHQYLREIKLLRDAGYAVYYQDETWVAAHHAPNQNWVIIPKNSRDMTFYDRTGGLRVPAGAGQRVIISHVGSESGFLANAADVFIGRTGALLLQFHK